MKNIPIFPKYIGNLRKLELLNLSGSHFVELPPEIGQLTNLQHLDLSHCRHLIALPCEIGQLKNLRALVLDGCENLIRLPETIGELADSLNALELDGCDFVALPNNIGNLHKLKSKWRLPMGLKTLPESIKNLSFIWHLIITIDDKHLSIIDDIARLMPNISTLEIHDARYHSNTSLTRLPETIGKLHNLKTLNLSGCEHLKSLPESSIMQLNNLKTLDLRYCPKLKISNDIFDALPNCVIMGKTRKK